MVHIITDFLYACYGFNCFYFQGSTALGAPLEIVLLGHTQVPYSVFFDYLNGLGEGAYA